MQKETPNGASTRTAIIGSLVENKTTESVVWVQATHQEAPLAIPAPCVAAKVDCGEMTVFCLQNAESHGTLVEVATFPQYTNYDTQGNPVLQDAVDMWVEFGETQPTAPPALDIGEVSLDLDIGEVSLDLDIGGDDSTQLRRRAEH